MKAGDTRHMENLEPRMGEPLDALTTRLRLVVNGEPEEIAAANLAEALVALDFADAIVATALNGAFVPKRLRAQTSLAEGDRIEIVAPRQGG
jgi:sulfur carrier protein